MANTSRVPRIAALRPKTDGITVSDLQVLVIGLGLTGLVLARGLARPGPASVPCPCHHRRPNPRLL
jgi:hypothetical protein